MAKILADNKTFTAHTRKLQNTNVFDMFPYPSGAGLHVGHPLGIASDVYSRYKDIKG
jgi:leucyl-tRNA synthetase